jgi:serine/threonine protein kinase
MAPEMNDSIRNNANPGVDIFASGVFLFTLLCGTPPFRRASKSDPLFSLLMNKKYDKFWDIHISNIESKLSFLSEDKLSVQLSFEIQDLICKMLAFNPKERPSITEIKKHPFYMKEVASAEEVIVEMQKRKIKLNKAQVLYRTKKD